MKAAALGLLLATTTIATIAAESSAARMSWSAFWQSVHVDPPPPESFLDEAPFRGKVLNLTTGRLSDDVVRQWVSADLRRGKADAWATNNLRRDITDSGILGPPGLNGSSEGIDAERAKHVVRIEGDDYAETIAAAVIWVSKDAQRTNPGAGYTDYVIVHVRRTTGRPLTEVLRSGARAPYGKLRKAGELYWQLDTGHFFIHPVLGPLWYQQDGWSCQPNDGTQMGEICGRVKP